MSKHHVHRLLALLLIAGTLMMVGSTTALAGKEQGSSHGQPFLSLKEYIDEIRDDLLDQIEDLEERIAANEGDIQQLMDELEALEQALADLEDTIENASCPAGYSIRNIDPLICEYDSTINDRLVFRRYTSGAVPVGYFRYGTVSVSCPVGWIATGCGHLTTPSVVITRSYPTNPRTCLAQGFGRLGAGSLRALATCALAAPSP